MKFNWKLAITAVIAGSIAAVLAWAPAASAAPVKPALTHVNCGSRTDFWKMEDTSGHASCFANNGSYDTFPRWFPLELLSSGNNHGYVWYYKNCDPARGNAGGPVVDIYVPDWSYVAHKCVTGFHITGR